ncbi:FAD binding domain in molybdopterin dehydrogenase family protein [Paraburkholderia xenovorans LB400]|uniref:Carbon monoxide dehydrogenase medium subunit n=1 Tax=Paraburkholderia xenovorans (strain LB400) TaxID=266265 RepID=Q13J87_PARXL|nr:xanthine dehydrogenase family protein subunit M [Paraburkholderia xenovorans]ABE35852.1 putative Carbon monoxide dehydrogenase medium subunit [Paraburkholderia xenovorans LB400]AIP36499.1 FAD binding domain in molybdopterin dehydrogenase family protein [Paraburkholderia xenovorans LB400]
MKPAAFSYHRPTSIDAVVELLDRYGFDAKVIAGGQSLAPMMNMRFAQPTQLIDLNAVPNLTGIERRGDRLVVGALTRHHDVAESALVHEACPLLAAAAATVGHYAIRQRGTLGGSLAHADPAAQLPLAAVTLGARIQAIGPRGTREIAAGEFALGTMTTALEPDEIVAAVHFPCRSPAEAHGFELFSRRHGDFAIASCAITATIVHGQFSALRIGIGGVSDVPVSLEFLAESFVGETVSDATCVGIAQRAAATVEPVDDSRISAAYRRELVEALCRRVLARVCNLR